MDESKAIPQTQHFNAWNDLSDEDKVAFEEADRRLDAAIREEKAGRGIVMTEGVRAIMNHMRYG